MQRNILTRDIGTYDFPGLIDFFIVDEENFNLYKNEKKFNCYYYQETQDTEINLNLNDEDYYIIFRNHAHMTNVILDYEIFIESSFEIDSLEIVTPSNDIFEEPIFTVGTTINIDGISTSDRIELTIDNKTEILDVKNNIWQYQWNTTNITPERYIIKAENENSTDIIYVQLIDYIPPTIEIKNPKKMDIFENEIVNVSGIAKDNFKIDKVELIINGNNPIILDGKEKWFYNLDITKIDTGEHIIEVKVYDNFGLTSNNDIIIINNESEKNYHPTINSLFIDPENPTNTSNVIVYSNVTSDSPFSIKKVIVCYDDGKDIIRNEMFRYGDFPPQERHIEDNIQHISNNPIYGLELGKFQTGEAIQYWIEAYDTANNKITSSIKTFEIN
jgi:hypothetical protein